MECLLPTYIKKRTSKRASRDIRTPELSLEVVGGLLAGVIVHVSW
jgi:hypothetical protein